MFIHIKYSFFLSSSLFFLFSFPVYGSEPVCDDLCDAPLPKCGNNYLRWGHSGYQCGTSLPEIKLFCLDDEGYNCIFKPMCGNADAKQCDHSRDDDSDDDEDDKDDENDDDDDDDDNDNNNSQACPNVKVKINAYPYKTGNVKLKCKNN